MEGLPPGHQCRGMTRSGDRCRRSGDPYCYQHSASSSPSAVRDGHAARSLDRVVVETAWTRALSGVSLSSIATAALPKIDTAAMAAAAMANIDTAAIAAAAIPKFDTAAMFAAAMPKIDTAAMFAAAMPKIDTASMIAAAMPKFDTAAMIAAAMPKFDTAAMLTAAMPKYDTAAMFAAAGAQVEKLAKITASLAELDTDHWAEAFEALDKTVLEKAFSDDGKTARHFTVEGSLESPALSTATAAVLAAAAEGDLETSAGWPEVAATGALVLILWVAYVSSPQLQQALDFIDFPIWIAPILWRVLWGSGRPSC